MNSLFYTVKLVKSYKLDHTNRLMQERLNTILQRVKEFLNVKMINLEKIKQEKCQPPTLQR